MMLYQQTILDSTIQPIAPSSIATSRGTTKQRHSRSVVFSSSTKNYSNDSCSSTTNTKRRRVASSSVPIPDALFRSPSELQLSVDEQVADERDFVFYARLMSGIRDRTRAANNSNNYYQQQPHYNEETERCLTHIMQTRHQQEQQQDGVPILRNEGNHEEATGYYLEDLDCLTSSSSSYSSSSTYQQDFDQERHDDNDFYHGESECIFDLEM